MARTTSSPSFQAVTALGCLAAVKGVSAVGAVAQAIAYRPVDEYATRCMHGSGKMLFRGHAVRLPVLARPVEAKQVHPGPLRGALQSQHHACTMPVLASERPECKLAHPVWIRAK